MDAERYAQIRELFLAADELPEDERAAFVRGQAGDDKDLIRQVLELLDEHDPEAAKVEGDRSSLPSAARVKTTELANSEADSKRGIGESNSGTSKTRPPVISSDSTRKWAQRTHAQPRHLDDLVRPEKPVEYVAPRVRPIKRNRNQVWFTLLGLLGVLIPTLLAGWLTSRSAAKSIQETEKIILGTASSNAANEVTAFLAQETRDVMSWAEDPVILSNVNSLVALAREQGDVPSSDFTKTLTESPHSELIASRLKQLSKQDTAQFAVWNRSGNTLATTTTGLDGVGEPISVQFVEQMSQVMRGQPKLFGPLTLEDDADTEEKKDTPAKPESIVMGIIVPIRNSANHIEAAMLVTGTDLYSRFADTVSTCVELGVADCYAVNVNGVLVSQSQHARELVVKGVLPRNEQKLATRLRISDPGPSASIGTLGEQTNRPLTDAAASLVLQRNGSSNEPYRNYAGEVVNGAWQWLDEFDLGLIAERDHSRSLAPANRVMYSFLWLSSLLSAIVLGAGYLSSRLAAGAERTDPLLQYEIGEPIGSGGMGVVFSAKHRHLGRPTALKVLRPDRQEPDDLLRFDREARVAAALDNAHIVTIYDYGRTADGEFYTAMEFLRGLTLSEVVARTGPQPIGRALTILRQVCDAMISAHAANLLHRDLKPQNVMLSLDASVGDWAVVFDFGLAKPLEPVKGMYQTSEAIWSGTPMYMAPERFRDPTVMDLRSDIYSLGCVAYFLMTGRPPFAECDPESLFALIISQEPISLQTHLGKSVPESIELFVRKCMAKSADSRFQSVQKLADHIDELRHEFTWSIDEACRWWKANGDAPSSSIRQSNANR